MKHIFKKIVVVLLEYEARLVLRKYKPHIIAVTGSVGKTSTKDAIYSVLSSSFYVRKSEKSFNSEIGIPLTILGLENAWSNPLHWIKNLLEGAALILLSSHYPRFLVLEVGADRPGDIEHAASWLLPHATVLTRFPTIPVHVEFFKSPEHVIEEKLHLVHALQKGGTVIVNADDEAMDAIGPPVEGSIVSYGFSEGADVRASGVRFSYSKGNVTGMTFRVDYIGNRISVSLKGVLGRQHIYPLLAAFALGISQGLNLASMGEMVKSHVPPLGRMRLIPGREDSVIIDDSYNSSPVAAEEALEALAKVKTKGRKIVVFGDMLELGEFSVEAHKALGKKLAGVADVLYVVGIRSHYSAEQARKSGLRKKKSIHLFNDAETAAAELASEVETQDVILVKGSQSMRMERIVEKIMSNPEEASTLLVRQDEHWLNIE